MGEFVGYLLDLIFLLAVARMLYAALRRVFAPNTARPQARNPSGGAPAADSRGEMERDPVCGMFVSTELSHRLKWKGQVLHFCSQECLEKYQSEGRAS